eukprot:7357038-Pyramimonas_sp.AAC.1
MIRAHRANSTWGAAGPRRCRAFSCHSGMSGIPTREDCPLRSSVRDTCREELRVATRTQRPQ